MADVLRKADPAGPGAIAGAERRSDVGSAEANSSDVGSSDVGNAYAYYVLGTLVVVYVFNFIDRQILSILAERIKADLEIGDAQLGFLYGTAFAVFYAVFGIPLGRLADVWVRKRLIAIGLGFWSAMTAASGFAQNFLTLGIFRIGVGVGEASATPAANSMLSDYFAPNQRATVLSIYASGIYIGSGIGMFLGGSIVDAWNAAYPGGTGPLGLKGWQAAFLAVGLPGILIAFWVNTLREPIRGQSDGIYSPPHPAPLKAAIEEFLCVVPPFTFFGLRRSGARERDYIFHLYIVLGTILFALVMIAWMGNLVQWVSFSLGIYAAATWCQCLAMKDRASFALIFRSRTMLLVYLGFPFFPFVTYSLGFWITPYILRTFDASEGEVGLIVGLGAAAGGWAGVTLGGVLSDFLRKYFVGARIYVSVITTLATVPVVIWLLHSENLVVVYILSFAANFLAPMWIGPSYAMVMDLVLPRMRASAMAMFILLMTLIGLALGPFLTGQLSDDFMQAGATASEGLRSALMLILLAYGIGVVVLLLSVRTLRADQESLLDRARAAGEVV